MGLLDKLNQLALEQNYKRMFLLEGDEFKEAALVMLGSIPNATFSNAHSKEMEMFLYKLFGKYMSADEISKQELGTLFYEFGDKGYPLAQELIAGSESQAEQKIFYARRLLNNPAATKEQKKQAEKSMNNGYQQFTNNIKEANSRATSRDALLEELAKMDSKHIQPLDPVYQSSAQGEHFNKEIAPFLGRLYNKVGNKASELSATLSKKSLEFLEAFAEAGYPSAQEIMGIIAYNKGDKKALNHWAKQVDKNPFSTVEQHGNAQEDIKETQAFMAQSQARGGR